MRIQESKKYFVLFYMVGFFFAIIYTNLMTKNDGLDLNIFREFFLREYSKAEIHTGELLWYISGIRIFPVIVMVALGYTRFRKVAAVSFLLWTGLTSGILMTTAVLKMGVKGVVFVLVGLLPHFVCYVAAYMILLWILFRYPVVKWNLTKTVSFLLLMALGMILESSVSPILMKMFLQTL